MKKRVEISSNDLTSERGRAREHNGGGSEWPRPPSYVPMFCSTGRSGSSPLSLSLFPSLSLPVCLPPSREWEWICHCREANPISPLKVNWLQHTRMEYSLHHSSGLWVFCLPQACLIPLSGLLPLGGIKPAFGRQKTYDTSVWVESIPHSQRENFLHRCALQNWINLKCYSSSSISSTPTGWKTLVLVRLCPCPRPIL